jgi:hypothetical protein
MTSLFLCWRCTVETIVYIFLQDFSKKKTLSIPVSCWFFIRKTDDILRTLLLMHDGISFDKIQPKQVGYLGTWINWKQRLKIENSVAPLAAPHRGLVLQVPHWKAKHAYFLKQKVVRLWNGWRHGDVRGLGVVYRPALLCYVQFYTCIMFCGVSLQVELCVCVIPSELMQTAQELAWSTHCTQKWCGTAFFLRRAILPTEVPHTAKTNTSKFSVSHSIPFNHEVS